MPFPSEFLSRVSTYFGNESTNFLHAITQLPSLSIRINPEKPISQFDAFDRVPWCNEGRYLSVRPDFTLDPLFHAGSYYVQEASSMFLSHIIKTIYDITQDYTILDLCAAPGGKSTLLSTLFSDQSLLLSNEAISSRVPVLLENSIKWGKPNITISHNDPSTFTKLSHFFDLVVIDAPCSGEGLFRKNPEAIKEWSLENINLCQARQKRILDAIHSAVKFDGYLIYCTCTFAPEENEKNIEWFLQQYPEFQTIQIRNEPSWGITEKCIGNSNKPQYTYHFYPHKTKGEGFFICCLKKTSPTNDDWKRSKLNLKLKKDNSFFLINEIQKRILKNWINDLSIFEFFMDKSGEIYAVHKKNMNTILFLNQQIKIKQAGIHIGKLIKESLIPSHHLAVSTIISNNIPSIEINKQEALQFLSRQNLELPTYPENGWYLAKFNGINLGWMKVLPRRINNYYPQEYRIRKSVTNYS